jgi:competence ComEA-like helix-hairpin-helix protein
MCLPTFPGFSPRQQAVLALGCALYGLLCCGAAWQAARPTLTAVALAAAIPAEVGMLIDPPVDVNTASHEELQLLPSIGPALAARILEYRAQHGPFAAVDELQHIRGIGPKTVEKLRPYLSFDN